MSKHTVPASAEGLPDQSRKSNATRRAARRKQDDRAFMTALLEPRPDGEVDDIEYNRLIKKCRRKAWLKAEAETQHNRAGVDYWDSYKWYCLMVKNYDFNHEKTQYAESERMTWVNNWRASVASQLLTPAYDSAGLAWKRRAAKKPCLPITPEEIEKAIAADEAFLAAHPTRRAKSKHKANCHDIMAVSD